MPLIRPSVEYRQAGQERNGELKFIEWKISNPLDIAPKNNRQRTGTDKQSTAHRDTFSLSPLSFDLQFQTTSGK